MEIKGFIERFADSTAVAFEALKQRIADNIRKAGKWATGKTAESMAVRVEKNEKRASVELIGRADFSTLEVGNPPKQRPLREFVPKIHEWAIAKGIVFRTPARQAWWDYKTATKINAEGDRLFRSGRKLDIYSSATRDTYDEVMQSFNEDIEVLGADITKEFADGAFSDISTIL